MISRIASIANPCSSTKIFIIFSISQPIASDDNENAFNFINENAVYFLTIIKTEGSKYDETNKAKKIAQSFGMDHHVFRVTKKDFKNDLPEILQAMDQPSIDGINVWYASKAAAKLKLKVCLLYTSPSPRDRQKSRMPSSA